MPALGAKPNCLTFCPFVVEVIAVAAVGLSTRFNGAKSRGKCQEQLTGLT